VTCSAGLTSSQHLKDFCGELQADAYAGFGHLYQAGHIQEAACMAHVRRKFYDIEVANGSPIASEAIQRIGALYDIEREIRNKPIELRHQVCQTRARPLVEELHVWMNETLEEMMIAGPGDQGEETAKMIDRMMSGLLDTDGAKPGEGPSREEREAGYYETLFTGGFNKWR
jgi:hypothetical protein